jgi:hypothetical protein
VSSCTRSFISVVHPLESAAPPGEHVVQALVGIQAAVLALPRRFIAAGPMGTSGLTGEGDAGEFRLRLHEIPQ